jgi:iron complex outermembrane recepter protein
MTIASVQNSFSRLLLATFVVASASSSGQVRIESNSDLSDRSLEELAKIDVISVAKKEQKLDRTAAAVFVITQEDIRRGGFSSIPEALRIVPGLQVARIDSNKWAISSRGFNGLFSNKLLVLIDGRSVYSPLFSGVYWDVQDTLLEDIDRIEVIRGPGAAIWGANAVNGVINIITKKTKDTQGGLVTVEAGDKDRASIGARYGGTIGSSGQYRAYTKYIQRTPFDNPGLGPQPVGWSGGRAGFRTEWNLSSQDSLRVQGDAYDDRAGENIVQPVLSPPFSQLFRDQSHSFGGNLLSSYTRRYSDTSSLTFQFYFDRFRRDDSLIGDSRNTYDFDLQHRFQPFARNDVIWGAGYRLTDDFLRAGQVSFHPDSRAMQLFNAFVNDEIALVNDKLSLSAGTKVERNDFTGFEVQPSLGIVWTPAGTHAFWASVSRAVRLPSRDERDVQLTYSVSPTPLGLPAVAMLNGDAAFRSEVLKGYEVGYRVQPASWFSLDITGFYYDYGGLVSAELGSPELMLRSMTPYILVPLHFGNLSSARSEGAEVAANWAYGSKWRLSAAYSALQIHTSKDPLSTNVLLDTTRGQNPTNQFNLRSEWNVTRRWQFDTSAYYVAKLPALNIPQYVRLDARLGWRTAENVEFSLGGQNLLTPHHREFIPEALLQGTEIDRSFYGRIGWRF